MLFKTKITATVVLETIHDIAQKRKTHFNASFYVIIESQNVTHYYT